MPSRWGYLLAGFGLLIAAVTGAQCIVAFTVNIYTVNVTETSSELGSERPPDGFVRVQCINSDDGTLANVMYVIATAGTFPFTINSTTGDFIATDDFDYDIPSLINGMYSVQVQCRNATTSSIFFDSASVLIFINPLNDNLPVLVTTYNVPVAENLAVSTLVASPEPGGLVTFDITDADAGPDGVLTYAITEKRSEKSASNHEAFSLNEETGEITLVKSLDADDLEDMDVLNDIVIIEMLACDGNRPADQCQTFVLTVFILRINDNTPQFSSSRYDVSVSEKAPVGELLTTASCSDNDVLIGAFSGIGFISQNDTRSGLWALNSTDGRLYLNGSLDYETVTKHELPIRCYDTGFPIQEDVATIVITVLPANEFIPQFVRGGPNFNSVNNRFIFTIDRLTIPSDGAIIGRLEATDDDDTGDANSFTYTLTGSSNFDINPRTGDIFLNDYVLVIEESSYDLTATVSDGEFNDTVSIDISVTGLLSVVDIIVISVGALTLMLLLILLSICLCLCLGSCHFNCCHKETPQICEEALCLAHCPCCSCYFNCCHKATPQPDEEEEEYAVDNRPNNDIPMTECSAYRVVNVEASDGTHDYEEMSAAAPVAERVNAEETDTTYEEMSATAPVAERVNAEETDTTYEEMPATATVAERVNAEETDTT